MKSTIEFILTYESKPQEIIQLPFVKSVFNDKQTLFEYATCLLSEEETKDIVKISCCVYTRGDNINLPDWYNESNGELWIYFNEIKFYEMRSGRR